MNGQLSDFIGTTLTKASILDWEISDWIAIRCTAGAIKRRSRVRIVDTRATGHKCFLAERIRSKSWAEDTEAIRRVCCGNESRSKTWRLRSSEWSTCCSYTQHLHLNKGSTRKDSIALCRINDQWTIANIVSAGKIKMTVLKKEWIGIVRCWLARYIDIAMFSTEITNYTSIQIVRVTVITNWCVNIEWIIAITNSVTFSFTIVLIRLKREEYKHMPNM